MCCQIVLIFFVFVIHFFKGDFLFWSKFYVHSKTDRKAQRIPTYPCPRQAQLPPVIASAGTLVAVDEPALRSHHHLEP